MIEMKNQTKIGMKYKKNHGDLIKESCANYDNKTGHCMLINKACPLVPFQYRNNVFLPDKNATCDYFNKSVLGIRKDAEATGKEGKVIYSTKDCSTCGKGFKPSNSRNKYCSNVCKDSATKKKYRRYNSQRTL
jgi:hypothetical protein